MDYYGVDILAFFRLFVHWCCSVLNALYYLEGMEAKSSVFVDAKRLENLLDQKLVNFSKFSASFQQETLLGGPVSSPSMVMSNDSASQSMAIEIQDLLRELADINDRIAATVTEGDKAHGTSVLHAQQHHRSRLREYQKDFQTIKSNIEQAKAQAELLSTVRKDISAYKMEGSREDGLLRERDAVRGAEDELSRVLGAAVQNRSSLVQQRGVVEGAITKLRQTAAQLPSLNQLMNKIKRRKQRDLIIIAVVCGLFIFLLYLYSRK